MGHWLHDQELLTGAILAASAGKPPRGTGSNKWNIEESDTRTHGVETSVEVGADLFKVFSASASVSFSYEDQVTSSTGKEIVCDCSSSQTGTLYWAPEYTQYHGSYKNGGVSCFTSHLVWTSISLMEMARAATNSGALNGCLGADMPGV